MSLSENDNCCYDDPLGSCCAVCLVLPMYQMSLFSVPLFLAHDLTLYPLYIYPKTITPEDIYPPVGILPLAWVQIWFYAVCRWNSTFHVQNWDFLNTACTRVHVTIIQHFANNSPFVCIWYLSYLSVLGFTKSSVGSQGTKNDLW